MGSLSTAAITLASGYSSFYMRKELEDGESPFLPTPPTKHLRKVPLWRAWIDQNKLNAVL